MTIVVEANENSAIISVPFDELETLGIEIGDEIELSKRDNEIILRPKQSERTKQILAKTREIIERRRLALIELGKGHE